MAEKLIQDSTLQGIANAIRTKDGTSASIQVTDFAQRISDIPSGIDINDFVNGTEPRGDVTLTIINNFLTNKFGGCNNITSLYMPNFNATIPDIMNNTTLGANAKIKKVSVPITEGAYNGSLRNCRQLRVVDCGKSTSLGSAIFRDCHALRKLILRKSDAICTLGNVNTFQNNPFQGYGSLDGVVYCPNSLIGTYEQATNWASLLATSFRAVENTRYENITWFESCNSTCTLDGTTIDVLDTETVAMFKITEGVTTLYENGVEVTDTTELVKGRTFTTSI